MPRYHRIAAGERVAVVVRCQVVPIVIKSPGEGIAPQTVAGCSEGGHKHPDRLAAYTAVFDDSVFLRHRVEMM